jgi:hypothetical protein
MSRIVQISFTKTENVNGLPALDCGVFIALCDDGSLWQRKYNDKREMKWVPLPTPDSENG